MTIKIHYTKNAIKFFKKNASVLSKNESDELVVKGLKKILKNEDVNVDIKKLKSQELFRIRKGSVRIVFSFSSSCEIVVSLVEDIDFRGNIYKK